MKLSILRLTAHLECSNIQKSLRFYRDALGFKVVCRGKEHGLPSVVLRNGEAHIGLFQTNDKKAYEKRKVGGGHYQFHMYFEVKSLERLFPALKRKWESNIGDRIIETSHGMKELVAQDPEGYQVTLAEKKSG